MSAPPIHIVLVGGGHAHATALLALAAQPIAHTRLTLISESPQAPYSGMLPGHVAGFYRREDMHLDLAALARRAGARFVEAAAIGLDRAGKTVLLRDHPPISYDLVSLNVGATPDLTDVAGAAEHGLPVKPISAFLPQLDAMLRAAEARDGPRRFAVVGGGGAGFELAIALRLRLDAQARSNPAAFAVTLVSGGPFLATLNAAARRRARAALRRADVALAEEFRVARVETGRLVSENGAILSVDRALLATAARAPQWLAGTGLSAADDGSILTRTTLQSLSDAAVFAVGDCALVVDDPRPKAGVFAVRQGPILAENLRRHCEKRPLSPYRAQRRFLTLLVSGERRAIAGRGEWLGLEGRFAWLWKDWIDRRFMARFRS